MQAKSLGADFVVVTIEAAAHGVEQCVSEVPRIVMLVSGMLYAVVLPYNVAQGLPTTSHACFERIGCQRIMRIRDKAAHDVADLHSVFTDIGHKVPCAPCTCLKHKIQMRKQRTAHTFALGFRGNFKPEAESVQLSRTEQIVCAIKTHAIHCIGAQRLARLCTVNQNGFHTEQRKRVTVNEFRFFVAVNECGKGVLRKPVDARRQNVLQAVKEFYLNSFVKVIDKSCPAHPAMLGTGAPLIDESQPKVEVGFREHQFVAHRVLGYRASQVIYPLLAFAERFPEPCVSLTADTHDGLRTGYLCRLGDFVVSVVRK